MSGVSLSITEAVPGCVVQRCHFVRSLAIHNDFIGLQQFLYDAQVGISTRFILSSHQVLSIKSPVFLLPAGIVQRSVFLCIQLIDFLSETLRVQALRESDQVSISGKLMEVDHLEAMAMRGGCLFKLLSKEKYL